MDNQELIDRLTTDREWAQANEYDAPICFQDDLSAAIAVVANYEQVTDWLRRNGFESFEALTEALSQVKQERDAAIEDWRGFCVKCAWNGKQRLSDGEMDARCATCRANNKCNWEWRGPQKEE